MFYFSFLTPSNTFFIFKPISATVLHIFTPHSSNIFIFASAVSYILKKPFVMLRKKNKLPADVHSVDFELEYGTATIEMHKDSISQGDKVIITAVTVTSF